MAKMGLSATVLAKKYSAAKLLRIKPLLMRATMLDVARIAKQDMRTQMEHRNTTLVRKPQVQVLKSVSNITINTSTEVCEYPHGGSGPQFRKMCCPASPHLTSCHWVGKGGCDQNNCDEYVSTLTYRTL